MKQEPQERSAQRVTYYQLIRWCLLTDAAHMALEIDEKTLEELLKRAREHGTSAANATD